MMGNGRRDLQIWDVLKAPPYHSQKGTKGSLKSNAV